MASRLPVWTACSSSAVRCTLKTASARDSVAGSTPRAFAVASPTRGVAITTRTRDGQALATLVTPLGPWLLAVSPPRIEALTLSGCPSSAVAASSSRPTSPSSPRS